MVFPCQIPAKETRPVVSVPSAAMPRLERSVPGGLWSTPFCMSMPFGVPVMRSK